MPEPSERMWRRRNSWWRRRLRRTTKRLTPRGREARRIERKIRELEEARDA